ncbi:glutamate synthase large subunit [Halocalculus aciditolerans]|uniref:Glutamate synthase n=1 Tax=Halocalculus aciditolerans TaxID=1383812 RepID=A0A830FJP5_9EURY|nr:glutamate synthase large subunit [Halocalculus aciditolerans]GGL63087.1 glutamate synthase [Halocalculus aciditolerans]
MSDPHTKSPAAPVRERANCGVGVVADLDRPANHDVLADALDLLENLEHRGATGAEQNTGDGAGVMIRTPHAFFESVVDDLPERYAAASLFLPADEADRDATVEEVESIVADHGLDIAAWRDVPTDNSGLGQTALDSEPHVAQAFVTPTDDADTAEFDRRLYVASRALRDVSHDRFTVCSFDRETVVYKGLLLATQLQEYYPDLGDDRIETKFAVVHARFSTNTLGAWDLAHPFPNVSHNGEFNTIRGNVNWMRARESDLEGDFSAAELAAVTPVVDDPDQSDTASLDDALGTLLAGGRSLPHAMRMLVPEAWRGNDALSEERRDFYDYHANLVEPWDGPALVIGTDGTRIGAVLDRNGLRPCRYEVTTDGRLVMASEQGALEHDASEVRERGRLAPGELFLADPEDGRIVPEDEVFDDIADDRYGEWVAEHGVRPESSADPTPERPADDLRAQQATFGYTHDELDELLEPMLDVGKDPVGSMGDDTPLAALDDFDRPISTYFRQQFAQVTNPPIDYIREELVTSLEVRLGRQRDLLSETPEHAHRARLDSPILTDGDLAGLRDTDLDDVTVDLTFDASADLADAVDRVRDEAEAAVRDGAELLVLSDRGVDDSTLAVPALLATGAVHHHLVREGLRARTGLVVESASPRTVHDHACLLGQGAGAINPYLGVETIVDIAGAADVTDAEAVETYRSALENGLLTVMARLGISTVESYRGAETFEIIGLDDDLVAEHFSDTPSRTGGRDLDDIEEQLRDRHGVAFDDDPELERQGEFSNRSNGRFHGWNPQSVHALQGAVRGGEYEDFADFSDLVNAENETRALRGLLDIESDRDPVPVEEVEPVEEIVERFSTAAMSLGSLSPEAHENNAEATNAIGAKSNTGEGGEPPERFDTERECSIKQVASGRFGVTSEYLAAADDLQIKMAQGSKPGEGGHLPGSKVNEMIADVRCATPGVGLISPPPQHDIYSIEDLKQLIYDLRAGNPDARVQVKLVSEAGIGTVAAGCAKAGADCIHISGHDGGTGASPKTSIKHAGAPWELGLAEANQLLRETGLRSRVTLRADGGMKTGRDVAVAALLGAEEFAFGTASLVTSGCVMARQCHENTCPVGVATQDEDLRERFPGQPQHVVNFLCFVAQELREIAADLGFTTIDEMVGRTECLSQRDVDDDRLAGIDLASIIAEPAGDDDRHKTREQDSDPEHFDEGVLADIDDALDADGTPVTLDRPVTNADRAVGGRLSNAVVTENGGSGLPDDRVHLDLRGTAGQSLGAWLAPGVTLDLVGGANDYVGKGLSGGKVRISTPADAAFDPAENSLIGNVALYGATDGELYVNGRAGERFAVRNSGAHAVVEGVGDHGCEYMTGGVVAVLGDVGKNFAAGMSGGVAYVHDPDGDLDAKSNTDMVAVSEGFSERDEQALRRLVENHAAYTDSERARGLLEDWEASKSAFVKVMPDAYRDAIAERPERDARRSLPEPAGSDSPAAAGSAD